MYVYTHSVLICLEESFWDIALAELFATKGKYTSIAEAH